MILTYERLFAWNQFLFFIKHQLSRNETNVCCLQTENHLRKIRFWFSSIIEQHETTSWRVVYESHRSHDKFFKFVTWFVRYVRYSTHDSNECFTIFVINIIENSTLICFSLTFKNQLINEKSIVYKSHALFIRFAFYLIMK